MNSLLSPLFSLRRPVIPALVLAALAAGCASLPHPRAARHAHDWIILFDGNSVEAWRGFRQTDFPAGGWVVQDGILSTVAGRGHRDIVTRESFRNFELILEWSVTPKGNSGIFYGVNEASPAIWHDAPEYQILDDAGHNQAPDSLQSAGSLYDLLGPSADKILRPVGEFNSTRLILRDRRAWHWLNGRLILEYHLDDPPLREKIAQSKFGEHPGFAMAEEGPVGLQHHGQEVSFRNIKIRRLD